MNGYELTPRPMIAFSTGTTPDSFRQTDVRLPGRQSCGLSQPKPWGLAGNRTLRPLERARALADLDRLFYAYCVSGLLYHSLTIAGACSASSSFDMRSGRQKGPAGWVGPFLFVCLIMLNEPEGGETERKPLPPSTSCCRCFYLSRLGATNCLARGS